MTRWRSLGGCLGRIAIGLCVVLAVQLEGHAATHFVNLFDDEFVPKNLTIAPGDTVVWTNQTGSAHTVLADDGSFASTESGQSFIPFGQGYAHTFPNAGRNPYFCQLHGGPGGQDMSGVIRVVLPGTNTAPTTPTNVSPAAGVASQSVAPTLTSSAFSDEDSEDIHVASQWILRNVATGMILDTGSDTVHKTSLPISDLEFSTTYAWKVRYADDRGGLSAYSPETEFTTVSEQTAVGLGLKGSYGRFVARTGLATILESRVDATVDFDWKLGKPAVRTPANNFYVRWEGTILPEFSERYRFRIKADGGVRLWVNGQAILDDWLTARFALFRNNTAELQAGVPATIRLEYFDTTGAASVSLRWSSRSQAPEVVPQGRLFPPSQ